MACVLGNKEINVHQASKQEDFSFQKVLRFYEE